MYSFHPTTQPPLNQGIGEMGVPPLSEQPLTDIRDNGFPVASLDLRVNPDVTYDTQIAVNRPPMYIFDLSMQPTSNEGVGEMDGSPPSDHSFPGTHDDFPVAPLDLPGNMYEPQFSVDPSQMYSFHPQMQPTSNEGMGEMDGQSLSEHSLADIRDNGIPVASLDLHGNSDVIYDPQIDANRPRIYSSGHPMQPTSNQGINEMDGTLLSGHSFPGFNNNGLPVASLDPRENSDATYGPHVSVVGSLVSCGAPSLESTRADVQIQPHVQSFNSPIQLTLTIIPHTPPSMQLGEESEPQEQLRQSSGGASPELLAAMSEVLDRPYKCRPYKCDCGNRYKQPQGLNRHIREKHNPSYCMFCKKDWGRSYLYREHLEKCHSDVDPDEVLGKPEGSYRRAAIMARNSQEQPKLPPIAAAKPV